MRVLRLTSPNDSVNPTADFFVEGWRGIVFTARFIAGKPGTRAENRGPLNIEDAFQGEGNVKMSTSNESSSSATPMRYVGARMSSSDEDEPGRNGHGPQTRRSSSLPSEAFGARRPSRDAEGYEQSAVEAWGYEQQTSYQPQQEDADMYERRTAAEEAYARQQRKYGTAQ